MTEVMDCPESSGNLDDGIGKTDSYQTAVYSNGVPDPEPMLSDSSIDTATSNGTMESNGGFASPSMNGDVKSSSSSKHHSKHSSSKDKHRPSSSSSKHHSSSSSSKDKHHSSSSSSKDKHHSSSSSSKDKHRSSSSSSKDKHHSSSSSSKDKHHSSSSSSSKDKHHSSSKDKHHSSGSSSKDKHHSSSSSSKDRHSSSKHSSSRDKHHGSSSSSSKDKHSSSSSKDKHSSSSSSNKDRHSGSSSSSKDKHHSSSKDKHSSSSSKHSSSSKDKVSSKPASSDKVNPDATKSLNSIDVKSIKTEIPDEPVIKQEVGLVKSETISKTEQSDMMDVEVSVKRLSSEAIRRSSAGLTSYKEESDSEDDVPLSSRAKPATKKRTLDEDSDDDVPLTSRMKKIKKEDPDEEAFTPAKKTKKKKRDLSDEEDDFTPVKKKPAPVKKKKVKQEPASSQSPKKAKKGDVKEEEKWKWWEEERTDDGTKWKFLEHKGPVFAPDYEPLPSNIRFFYDGKVMKLSLDAEEVATFYGRMLDHDYTTMDAFNTNFFKDWRSVMTSEEKSRITDLKKCNFNEINVHFKEQSEKRKAMSKEEKKKIKEKNEAMVAEYGFCIMDHHKEKIGNFRIEPPGLFRGRGSHPKMGKLKRRTNPEDVIINCSKDSKWPEPPAGHKWKKVQHDNTVSWLACWTENVQGQNKYVMLNAASRLKGEKDWQKYETARRLHQTVHKIRAQYREDWKSKEMRIRQRSTALYFIDKLALRAGNEKDGDETADTVGCCSLRVEHITLHEKLDDQEYVVEFDFLGKDSIRYYNKVSIEKRPFKNLQLFMKNKNDGDDLFDRLNTSILNKHLQNLMDGLTAKVFRTYNASRTLQDQLNLLTDPDDPVPAKMLSYNRANRAVAILCNHQRAVPKNFEKQMENLQVKIDAKKEAIKKAKKEFKTAKADFKTNKDPKSKTLQERKKKAVARLEEQLTKLEVQATDKDENKEIALGTSKLNYLDPRISVAWCKKWDVPIEKIYNKTQRDKFAWAIEMADDDFEF